MIIAQEKRKSNIAEYVLYMWQIEDIIRASKFDIEILRRNIIDQFKQPPDIKYEIKEWYIGLIELMKKEYILQKGHLQFVKKMMIDLNDLHLLLLKKPDETKYHEQYYQTKPNIDAFRNKSVNNNKQVMEIELCFNALYAIMLMRLQKRSITIETDKAIETISRLLALLSQKYKQMEEGLLKL